MIITGNDIVDFTALTAMAKDIVRHLGLPNIAVYPVDLSIGVTLASGI